MKKLLFITLAAFMCDVAQAQPWMQNLGEGPVKLSDVVEAYKNSKQFAVAEADDREAEEEGKHYHFDRWLWYWEQHTDQNGYMVPPAKTFQELQKFQRRSGKSMSKTTADPSNWTFQGPSAPTGAKGTGLGRINVVAFHPTDTNTFWVGTPGGGAWKTTDFGQSWADMTSMLPVLGVSDIVFNPFNPNTIYLCTGDRDASDTYGIGVLKSTDGGQTWDTTGIQWNVSDFEVACGMVINPLDSNSLTLASSEGIHKSYDGGSTWTLAQGGQFKQIVYHPTDTAVVFAAGSFSTNPNQIFRSTDGGATWQAVTSFPSNARVMVAVTPANPAMVKAVVANTSSGLLGIYNSSDSGKTFTQIFNDGGNCATNILSSDKDGDKCGGQGWYDLAIAISPLDSNFVIVGGVRTWMSQDGGYSWQHADQFINPAPGIVSVHVDKHYLAYHPLKPDMLFECNDGGIYFTTDPVSTIWTKITNGLGITQFYRNAISDNASFVLGGSQDNGTKQLLPNNTYDNLTGADGMECQIDYSNNQIFYTTYQYGRLWRTTTGGVGNFTDITPKKSGNRVTGEWITPFIIHPTNPDALIAGYENLYYSPNRGFTWEMRPYNFGDDIDRIAMSAADPNTIYVIEGNTISMSNDMGYTWQPILATFGSKSDIAVDPHDGSHIWVTFSGYGGNKTAHYRPSTGWQYVNDSLPDVPVNCIVIDTANGTIYVGTDIGVFYKDPANNYWEPFINNLPAVEIRDLGINYTTDEIWAATYGRGMWKSPKHATTTSIQSIVPFAANKVTVYPNPGSGVFNVRAADKSLNGKRITLKMTDVTGKTAWQSTSAFNSSGEISFNTSELPRGNYILEISDDTIIAREKVVIVK